MELRVAAPAILWFLSDRSERNPLRRAESFSKHSNDKLKFILRSFRFSFPLSLGEYTKGGVIG